MTGAPPIRGLAVPPDPAAAVLIGGGSALLGLLPFPWMTLGATAAIAGVLLRPWLAIPAVVLTLPYHAHPKSLGGIDLALSEMLLLLSFGAVAIRALLERTSSTPLRLDIMRLRRAVGNESPLDALEGLGAKPPGRRGGWAGIFRLEAHAVRRPRPMPVDWLVALFVLAGLLSLLVTDYPKQSLRELRWLVVEPVLFYYLVRATVSTGGQTVTILWSLAISGAAAALVSLAGLAAEGTLADPSTRGVAPYQSPNHLGLFLGRAAAAALALTLFVDGEAPGRGRVRWLAGLLASTIVLGILRSISLGAWAGLAAVSIALAALRRRLLALLATAVVAGVVLGAIVLLGPERTVGRLDPSIGTGLSRLQVWGAATRMIADHPILGLGLDNFLYAYRTEYMVPEAWREPNLSHPHNWVLHFWLQLGLLGLGAAIGLILWTAATAYRLFRRPREVADVVLAACVGGMLLDFLVHGSLDNSYFLPDAAALWWLGIALLAVRADRP